MPRKQQFSLERRTVSITAIKVDGSKMTSSVFRQIPEEDIFDKTFKMVGTPWGNINYFWNGADKFNDTVLHVLWQKGGELRRNRFSDVINGHENHLCSRDYYIARFTGQEKRELSEIEHFFRVNNKVQPPFLWLSNLKEKYGSYPPSHYARHCSGSDNSAEYQAALDLADKLEKRKIELSAQIEQRKNDAEAYIAVRHRAYQRLTQLPQLFLA